MSGECLKVASCFKIFFIEELYWRARTVEVKDLLTCNATHARPLRAWNLSRTSSNQSSFLISFSPSLCNFFTFAISPGHRKGSWILINDPRRPTTHALPRNSATSCFSIHLELMYRGMFEIGWKLYLQNWKRECRRNYVVRAFRFIQIYLSSN